MAKRIKALVEPAVLAWARTSASVTTEDAAKAAGVAADVLEAWEEGADAPTVSQLRKLADKYKRPLSVFYLSEPPEDFTPLRDFRRLPDTAPGIYTPKLAFEVRAAHERRLIALDLMQGLGEEPEQLGVRASTTDDAEAVGMQLRARLGIGVEKQSRWGDGDRAFRAWREAIENAGVLVFALSGAHHQVPLSEMRGFAIAEQPLPTIVVNGKDRSNGRIFTLMHELAHVAIGQSAIENDVHAADAMPAPDRATEAFCNRVAAAVLMPRDHLQAEQIMRARAEIRPDWSDLEIAALARRYCVSREALVLRLVQIGRASQAFYDQKRRQYARQVAVEEELEDAATEGGFAPYHYQVLGHLGRRFARLVLQSYYARQITLSSVSGYLGMQAKYVPNIERAALNPAG